MSKMVEDVLPVAMNAPTPMRTRTQQQHDGGDGRVGGGDTDTVSKQPIRNNK